MRAHNLNDQDLNLGRLRTKEFIPFLRTRAGFTIVEAMISLALFLLILGAMFIVMMKSLDSFYIGNGRVCLTEETSRAIDEISRMLGESNVDTITFAVVSDELTGGNFPMLILPSARGNPQTAPPDDSFHLSFNSSTFGEPDWQSVVVYYPYQSQGITQLRQYGIYDSEFSKGFPFTADGINTEQIEISNSSAPPQVRTIQRASGRVVTNHFNLNGNYRIQRSGNLLSIDLPLMKQIRQAGRGADFFLYSNVRSAVTLKSRALKIE